MDNLPTLVLFPGLGVDARVYASQKVLPARVEAAEWIEPESMRESLDHYSQRMAERIVARPNLYLGGISMGAMVALEAARHVAPAGVFMIGGCTSHRQISPLFRAALRAGAMLPAGLIRPVMTMSPLPLRLLEKLDDVNVALMTRMLKDHSPMQTRWSCRAVMEWEYRGPVPKHVWSIHGENDEVIPIENVKPDDVIAGGHHLISLAHAREVNPIIADHLRADMAKTPEDSSR